MLPPTACLPEMSSRSSSTPWTLLPRIPQVGSSARPPVAAPPWRTLPPPSAPVARLTLWWSPMPPLASSSCNCWVLAVGGSWPAPPCSPRKVPPSIRPFLSAVSPLLATSRWAMFPRKASNSFSTSVPIAGIPAVPGELAITVEAQAVPGALEILGEGDLCGRLLRGCFLRC